MGRHSASRLAAMYVGAAALAIGVGAAVACAAPANAETPASSVGGVGASSSPEPNAEPGSLAKPTSRGPAGVKPHKPGLVRPAPRQPTALALPKPVVRHAPSTAAFSSALAYPAAHPAVTLATPTPADEVPTAYGDIGKWMLQPNGQLSNYGGQSYGGKTMLEPINVIIVDPKSMTAAQASWRLNTAMFWSGFPAQFIHSSGFLGAIDGTTYGQQPGFLQGYSDNFFLLPDDHGRMFGPSPVATGTGYVWSGTFSSETLGFSGLPGHVYVSSDMARTALAIALITSGQATFVGMVPLDNAADTATTTTGDHDGYAVVLQLT
ncbi:MAG: hypothetical protein ABWY93_09270 [Mycobacterium sp.]